MKQKQWNQTNPLRVTSVCRRPSFRNMSMTVSIGVWSVTVMGACTAVTAINTTINTRCYNVTQLRWQQSLALRASHYQTEHNQYQQMLHYQQKLPQKFSPGLEETTVVSWLHQMLYNLRCYEHFEYNASFRSPRNKAGGCQRQLGHTDCIQEQPHCEGVPLYQFMTHTVKESHSTSSWPTL